ncbi:hypothetical protein GWK47_004591 [Chionoecetes opilio]|uniref:Uncharacterized protein n=1 Tax=Chionoecetes opilio TaxID=41210 RepID=A0A8J5CMA5_CHIOP|nr:hypothetical protein GWK47_004591 [Chionoecetes opilio]
MGSTTREMEEATCEKIIKKLDSLISQDPLLDKAVRAQPLYHIQLCPQSPINQQTTTWVSIYQPCRPTRSLHLVTNGVTRHTPGGGPAPRPPSRLPRRLPRLTNARGLHLLSHVALPTATSCRAAWAHHTPPVFPALPPARPCNARVPHPAACRPRCLTTPRHAAHLGPALPPPISAHPHTPSYGLCPTPCHPALPPPLPPPLVLPLAAVTVTSATSRPRPRSSMLPRYA